MSVYKPACRQKYEEGNKFVLFTSCYIDNVEAMDVVFIEIIKGRNSK